MDSEKDKYIREKLQKDELISKKADDVFNNFLKNDIYKLNNENPTNSEISKSKEKSSEKVVKLSSKINKTKKILSMAASFMIIFLVANVYAATKGYNNIFFIIRKLFVNEEIVLEKDKILSDRDITISYEFISIAEGVKVQVNNLKIKDENAELLLSFKEKINTGTKSYKMLVYDITDGEERLIGKHEKESMKIDESTKEFYEEIDYENQFSEIVKLTGLTENTNDLRLIIKDEDENNIAVLDIDIEGKYIDIVSSMASDLQKLSETELKLVLVNYVELNLKNPEPKDNLNLLLTAMDYIFEKEANKEIKYSKTKVDKAVKELTGKSRELNIPENEIVYLDTETNEYKYYDTYKSTNPVCIEIEDLIFENGIYTATITYCVLSEGESLEDVYEEKAIYRTTIKFKVNSSYTYAKYCVIDVEESEVARQPIANTELQKLEKNDDKSPIPELKNTIDSTIVENYEEKDGYLENKKPIIPSENTNLNINVNNTEEVENTNKNDSVLENKGQNIPSENTNININTNVNNTTVTDIVENIENNSGITSEKKAELKDTVEKYILMNFYKDRDAISYYTEEEHENEMKVLTAFKLDFGHPSSPTQYLSIDKTIVYAIIEAYTGKEFNDNTTFSQIIFKRESTATGGAFSYIARKIHELEANILEMENIEYIDGQYKITFTYSYSFYPEDKYRATMTLKPISPYGIPSMYVKYQLMDDKIKSEKIN